MRMLWRLMNPIARRTTRIARWWVVLETTGRRSGRPRPTPLARGPVIDGALWLIAVHGHHSLWVRNLEADPRVRVQLAGAWRTGRASAEPYDEAIVARFNLYARTGPATVGIDPCLVRVELG
jgi:deazaflavin-dependent oxidoreductase (nitroreductase family)